MVYAKDTAGGSVVGRGWCGGGEVGGRGGRWWAGGMVGVVGVVVVILHVYHLRLLNRFLDLITRRANGTDRGL